MAERRVGDEERMVEVARKCEQEGERMFLKVEGDGVKRGRARRRRRRPAYLAGSMTSRVGENIHHCQPP